MYIFQDRTIDRNSIRTFFLNCFLHDTHSIWFRIKYSKPQITNKLLLLSLYLVTSHTKIQIEFALKRYENETIGKFGQFLTMKKQRNLRDIIGFNRYLHHIVVDRFI